MYRIHFDQNIGRFVIQVLIYGFFWKTVMIAKRPERDPINFSFEEHSFRTFEETNDYIKEIGLDKLYQNKSIYCFHKHMNHGHTLG